MTKGGHATITIPEVLYKKIKRRAEDTGFSSVSDYVTYVLREVLSNLGESDKEDAFSKEEEEKVKQRLKALGYLE